MDIMARTKGRGKQAIFVVASAATSFVKRQLGVAGDHGIQSANADEALSRGQHRPTERAVGECRTDEGVSAYLSLRRRRPLPRRIHCPVSALLGTRVNARSMPFLLRHRKLRNFVEFKQVWYQRKS